MSFVSFSRHHLDRFLASIEFSGTVLDVGGHKKKKRGAFVPPVAKTVKWIYLNVDAATEPDILGSAEKLPLADGEVDFVVLTEVLEHLENPGLCLRECARVLKPGGTLVATMPFLYSVHGHPSDFQRWTPTRIGKELSESGFNAPDSIAPRGGLIAVVSDLVDMYVWYRFGERKRIPIWVRGFLKMKRLATPLALKLDAGLSNKAEITTGYCFTAVRRG